jgi:hypothetical protein
MHFARWQCAPFSATTCRQEPPRLPRGAARDVTLAFAELGGKWASAGAAVKVYDIWAHAVIDAAATGGITANALAPHGSAMYKLTIVN